MMLSVALVTTGAELSDFPEKADWNDAPGLVELDGDILQLEKGLLNSTETFKIDPSKEITVSGEFRTLPGKKVRLFLAFQPYDANGKHILASHVNVIAGSDSELIAPVGKKDTTLKVKDASKFIPGTKVAFETVVDYSDLPNGKVSHGNFKSAEKQPDGTWVITLTASCGLEYPAGTKVRAHGGGGYQYANIVDLNGDKWVKVQGKVKGIAKSGLGGKNWRPGTATAGLMIFGGSKDKPIQFRNVKLEIAD